MSRRKHYRKVRQQRFEKQALPADPMAKIAGKVDENPSHITTIRSIRYDLGTTAVTTVILICLLVGSAILNNYYHWTLKFGEILYRLFNLG